MSDFSHHSQTFIKKLANGPEADLVPATKMKLLNINAMAKILIPTYNGPTLAKDSQIFRLQFEPTKNKAILQSGLINALKSLFSSADLIRTNNDTGMGFAIGKYKKCLRDGKHKTIICFSDAECVLDGKGNPLPVNKTHKNATRFVNTFTTVLFLIV